MITVDIRNTVIVDTVAITIREDIHPQGEEVVEDTEGIITTTEEAVEVDTDRNSNTIKVEWEEVDKEDITITIIDGMAEDIRTDILRNTTGRVDMDSREGMIRWKMDSITTTPIGCQR